MIIYDPIITGSFQINGSTISSVESIDAVSQSVADLKSDSGSFSSRVSLVETSTNSLNQASSSYALKTDISGSLGINATLIRSLTAGSITGSNTAFSSSITQRVTPLETSVSSLNSASSSYLLNTSDTLVGDLTVTGTITAQEFHTEFVSASILYDSGSTKFGNSADDVHSMTGSLQVSGTGRFTNALTINNGVLNLGNDSVASYVNAVGDVLILDVDSDGNSGGTPNIQFKVGGSTKALLNSSGNLGLGVTPSTLWSTSYNALQIGLGGSIYAHSSAGNALKIGSNIVYEGTAPNYYDKYLNNSTATKYEQDAGTHTWSVANSGTAGNAISWTEAMRINNSGNLSIGNTNDTYKLDVSGTGRFTGNVTVNNTITAAQSTAETAAIVATSGWSGTVNNPIITFARVASAVAGAIGYDDPNTGLYVGSTTNHKFAIRTNNTDRLVIASTGASVFNSHVSIVNGAIEFGGAGSAPSTDPAIYRISGLNDLAVSISSTERMRITSGGNVGIGTTSPVQRLHVNGNIALGSTANAYQEAGSKFIGTAYNTMGTDGYTGIQIESVNAPAPYSGNYSQNIKFYTHHYGAGTGGTPRVTIQYDGKVGIGMTSPNAVLHVRESGLFNNIGTDSGYSYIGTTPILTVTTDGNGIASGLFANNAVFKVGIGGGDSGNVTTEHFRVNLNGKVGIGTTSPIAKLDTRGDVIIAKTTTVQDSFGGPVLSLGDSTTEVGMSGGIAFVEGLTVNPTNVTMGLYYDGKLNRLHITGPSASQSSAGQNLVNATKHFTVTRDTGYVYLGDGWSATNHRINLKVTQGDRILVVSGYDSVSNDSVIFYAASGANPSATATVLGVTTNNATGRSISTGGTINASGSDYAEYITKAVDDIIAKGDIVGINSQAKLTNIFADAISFAVKSTDPSYVGGDTWFNNEKRPQKTEDQTQEEFDTIMLDFESRLETERAKVDRIAFSGQVPCNVYNAQVGDYIIPIETEDGKIAGQPVSNPTFEQYTKAVGKVWKIMDDGRAWISVKIG